VSWARVIEPAIRLAENGFLVSDGLATTLRREWLEFSKYESSRALFFPAGRPLAEGDTLRNPDLARTLRAIAEGGADAFYKGDIAKRMAADLGAAGNPIRESDLARYFAVERKPVHTTYRGHDIYSGPPPVTGGAVLVAKLNLLEQARRGRSLTEDASGLHAMIETWKLQPSTGGRIADPDLWPVDVSPFESKDTARARWRCFDPERATSPGAAASGCDAPSPGGAPDPADGTSGRSTGTTAFAVADGEGNAVSVTQTLGTWGGNFYVTPGLGFLYNDKAVAYRGPSSNFGASLPFGRVGTVIAPTLVYDGTGARKRPLLAVGAAGNAWITAAVYTAVVGVIDFGLGPQQALELPRMLVSGGGGFGGPRETIIQVEDGFSPAAIRELEAMGHRFRRISLPGELRMGYGAAVLIRNGRATAGADPRRSGAAGAVR
jgi:gamma-glutamyltranspeptidase